MHLGTDFFSTRLCFAFPNSGTRATVEMRSVEWQQLFHWNGTVQWVLCIVYETHKSLYSATFSLKMGLTVLFTHLKIILLQCFSIFNFQFSAVSKQTLNLTQTN